LKRRNNPIHEITRSKSKLLELDSFLFRVGSWIVRGKIIFSPPA